MNISIWFRMKLRNKESSYVLPKPSPKFTEEANLKDDHDIRRNTSKIEIDGQDSFRNKTPINERKILPMLQVKRDCSPCNYELIDLSSKPIPIKGLETSINYKSGTTNIKFNKTNLDEHIKEETSMHPNSMTVNKECFRNLKISNRLTQNKSPQGYKLNFSSPLFPDLSTQNSLRFHQSKINFDIFDGKSPPCLGLLQENKAKRASIRREAKCKISMMKKEKKQTNKKKTFLTDNQQLEEELDSLSDTDSSKQSKQSKETQKEIKINLSKTEIKRRNVSKILEEISILKLKVQNFKLVKTHAISKNSKQRKKEHNNFENELYLSEGYVESDSQDNLYITNPDLYHTKKEQACKKLNNTHFEKYVKNQINKFEEYANKIESLSYVKCKQSMIDYITKKSMVRKVVIDKNNKAAKKVKNKRLYMKYLNDNLSPQNHNIFTDQPKAVDNKRKKSTAVTRKQSDITEESDSY